MSLAYAPMETAAMPKHLQAVTPPPTADVEGFAARQARLLTGNLTLLMALEANGLHRKADALLGQIAIGIGRQPPKLVRPQAVVQIPEHERGRSADHLRRLDILTRRIAKPLSKGDKKAEKMRAEDLAERDALEALPSIKADQRWQREALAETEALAARRGEHVAEDKAGVKRILDRDPVVSLSHRLTHEQFDTAIKIRDLYDSRAADAGAMEYTGMPSGGHDHERFVANRFERAQASAVLGRIERAVAINCSAEPACLTMLRVICERGHSLTSQGRGRVYERNAAAFCRALDVAEPLLP